MEGGVFFVQNIVTFPHSTFTNPPQSPQTFPRHMCADELVDTLPQDEKASLEPILVRLMMELRIVISDFEYDIDRHGRPYGSGIARYTTPETLYGNLSVDRTPEDSYKKIFQHFKGLFPEVPEKKLLKLIG